MENRMKKGEFSPEDNPTVKIEDDSKPVRLYVEDPAYAWNRTLDALDKLHEARRRIIEEEKLVAVARLAAGVAHEINNPLGFIQSNLHTLSVYARILADGSDRMLKMAVLLLGGDAGLQDEAAELLDWMKKVKLGMIRQDIEPLIAETCEGIGRIASIVNSLRVLDQANRSIKKELEDLGEVVSASLFRCRLNLPPDVSLLTDCDGPQIITFCNRGQLNIALDNILQNALDAVGENGEIRVRLFKNESWASVQVLDTGDGIPTENLSKVFDLFFTTRAIPGKVGLGLTVAQCLVHAHGGRIEISSASGQGSKVMIMLPLELNDLSWNAR
jgi:two-component system NtrC family sensor kinase